ncbi:MAG: GlxA family transcriptional regulator [Rhizobacter sp.]|nr:GlxA family transcriptional regulator [Rhizobacter sp.]
MTLIALPPAEPERIAFVLLPQCSLMALGGALDALAHANQASRSAGERLLYDVLLASTDGRPVTTGSGASVAVDFAIADLPRLDGVVVVSDTPVPQSGFDPLVDWLQAFGQGLSAERRWVGGIGTGAYLLARAGLLRGHRATLHWAYAPLLARAFSETVVSSNVFESDRRRLTCASGHAAFDMMLHRVGETHGPTIVEQLLASFSLEKPRGPNEPQRVPLSARIGGGQPKLTEAVALMEANIEEPLATEDIARLVGVSRRQLERLFKLYLDSLPSRYYIEMRLTRARQLLQQTSQSILQVGLACGFSSGPHFSNAYRAHFGVTPREQRSQRVIVAMPAPAPDSKELAP